MAALRRSREGHARRPTGSGEALCSLGDVTAPESDVIAWLDPDVRQEREAAGLTRQPPDLTRQHLVVDPGTGTVWRRRGTNAVPEKRLWRLLADPEVRVLHLYQGRVDDVPPAKRAAFWSSAQASMAESAHAAFTGAEFTSGEHAHLLVIRQDC
jgi:hypothetical protein